MSRPRCLVVEDEDLLGDLVVENLASDGFEITRARDGLAARALLETRPFDLVVLDIMLPGIDGFAVLRALRARGLRTPVLVLSARATPDDRIRGLELQADDYLTKPFHLRELLLRCRALLRRTGRDEQDLLEFAGNRIDFRARTATTWQGETVALTPSEVELLRLLCAHPGEVVTRREIVDTVFGPGMSEKHRTLDNLVTQLRRHFERDRRAPRHLHTVRGVGLRLTVDDPISRS